MSSDVTHWLSKKIKDVNERKAASIDPSKYPNETFELFSVPIFPTGIAEIIQGKDIGSTKQIVEPGDVLLCKINPRINRVWVVSEAKGYRQIASSEWIVIRSSIHENYFLKYFFQESSFRDLLCSDVSGVGGSLTRAKPKLVNEYEVAVAPLPEQKRIVEKLDEVLAQVDTIKARLDGIPDLLKRFRQSVLASAVSGKLTEEWRGKTSPMKKIAISQDHLEIPVQWDIYDLESLINPSRKICYGVVQPGEEVDGGKKLIRVCDINNGAVNTENLRTISSEIDEQYSRSKVHKFDLLVTIVGAIGRVAMIERDIDANIARAVARVSPNTDLIEPRYLHIWLSCPKLQWWLNNSSREVARKTLNLSELKQANVALPCLKEQKEIVRLVDQYFAFADTIEAQVKKAQARVDNLTQSILAKAFRGELVPQNDDDEPAEVLLERIVQARKEAEALAKVAKKSGKKKA